MLSNLGELGFALPLVVGFGAGLLLFLTRRYWLGPIQLWGVTTPVTARSAYTANAPVAPAAAQHLDAVAATLAALGFVPTPPLRGGNDQVTIYLQHHAHPESGDVGTALAVFVSGQDRLARAQTALATYFEDGTVALTSTDTSVGLLPDRPGDTVIRIPEEDVANLHAIHQSLLRRHPGRGRRRRPLVDPLEFQMESEARWVAHATSAGWFTSDGRALRRTWKGACLGIWRELPPWSWVRSLRDRRWWMRVLSDVQWATSPCEALEGA